MDCKDVKKLLTVLNHDRHYRIYSAILKIEKGKQLVRTFGNFILPNGVKICSVNLDRETTFLTLAPGVTYFLNHPVEEQK